MDAGYKGVNAAQDLRFSNKEQKLIKSTTFPVSFQTKVDMRKVNIEVMRPWIAKTIKGLIGTEDDIVVEYVQGLMEDSDNPIPDPRKMQISLTGFLEGNTAAFMAQLWDHLISAQTSIGHIPQAILEEKKAELLAKQKASDAAQHNNRGAMDAERERENRLNQIREQERSERGRNQFPPQQRSSDYRGGDSGRGGRANHRDNFQGRNDRNRPEGARERNGNYEQQSYQNDDRRGSYGRDTVNRREPNRRYSPRSRSPPRYRQRSNSRDRFRGRSPSRTPPRRENSRSPRQSVAARARALSRTPPRYSRDRSETPPRRRERSVTPPRRRDRSITPSRRRDRSITPPRYRKRSVTPLRRYQRSPTPPPRRRERSVTPEHIRQRSVTPSSRRKRSESVESRLRNEIRARREPRSELREARERNSSQTSTGQSGSRERRDASSMDNDGRSIPIQSPRQPISIKNAAERAQKTEQSKVIHHGTRSYTPSDEELI